MKFSELIAHVGDEHVKVQSLVTDFTTTSQSAKGATVTFATDRGFASELGESAVLGTKPDHIGLVVWLPRERCPESMR